MRNGKIEYRTIPLELKQVDDAGRFSGLGAVFGNVDLQGDVIKRGAFRRTLAERGDRPLKMLYAHRDLIGAYDAVREGRQGLVVEGRPLDTVERGREAIELLKAGVLDELSIGFVVPPGGQEFDEKRGVRVLTDVELLEVSLVPFAANPRARVTSVTKALDLDDEELIDALRRGELTDDALREVVAACRKALGSPAASNVLTEALAEARRALES